MLCASCGTHFAIVYEGLVCLCGSTTFQEESTERVRGALSNLLEVARGWIRPEVGATYQHRKTKRLYRVLAVAKVEAEPEKELVIYTSVTIFGATWSRPLEEWMEDVEVDGELGPRFVKQYKDALAQFVQNRPTVLGDLVACEHGTYRLTSFTSDCPECNK